MGAVAVLEAGAALLGCVSGLLVVAADGWKRMGPLPVLEVGDGVEGSLPGSLVPGDEPFTRSVVAALAVDNLEGGLNPGTSGFLACNKEKTGHSQTSLVTVQMSSLQHIVPLSMDTHIITVFRVA